MVPVYPYHVRKSNTGEGGEMLLSIKDRKTAMVLQLSMNQARVLAVEMRGLATDHCSLHHLVGAVTKSLGAEVSGVVIRGVECGQVTGAIRMECRDRVLDVDVDVAAALAIALHLGLPIFMDSVAMLREDRLEYIEERIPERIEAPDEIPDDVSIPEAFREVIEALDLPAPSEGLEKEEREM